MPEPDPREAPGVNPLTSLEVTLLNTGITGEADAKQTLRKQVEDWAGRLSHVDTRNEGRVRYLARMISVLRAKMLVHETLREEALTHGTFDQALLLEHLLESETRRLLLLTREHRHECGGGTRVVKVTAIAVGDRPQVNVVAGDVER